jgi:pimeloyl-ACP methyl ester carboxylesterase
LLKKSHVPVRIVWGTGDTIFSQADAAYLEKTLPHALGVRRIEGAKLFFPEEFPGVIADEARNLWKV